jgi:hypothetical protein
VGVTNNSGAFNTTTIVPALTPSNTTITYTQGEGVIASAAATGTGCILPMKRDANGNFTIYDPAPLVTSGTHSITTV